MKKIFVFLLFVVLVLGCLNPKIAFAADGAGECPEIAINCVAIDSEAKGKELVVYFKNIETEEVISRKISTTGFNRFSNIPIGEYEFVKCVLAKEENIEFELESQKKNLVVTEDGAYYSFRLAEKPVEKEEGAIEAYEKQSTGDGIFIGAAFLIVPLLLAWGVFALIGIKNERCKMIAKLLLHILSGVLGFMLGMGITANNIDKYYMWILFMGFPFGILFVLWIWLLIEGGKDYTVIYADADQGCAVFLIKLAFVGVLGFIVGVIAFPVILVRDIIRIIRA